MFILCIFIVLLIICTYILIPESTNRRCCCSSTTLYIITLLMNVGYKFPGRRVVDLNLWDNNVQISAFNLCACFLLLFPFYGGINCYQIFLWNQAAGYSTSHIVVLAADSWKQQTHINDLPLHTWRKANFLDWRWGKIFLIFFLKKPPTSLRIPGQGAFWQITEVVVQKTKPTQIILICALEPKKYLVWHRIKAHATSNMFRWQLSVQSVPSSGITYIDTGNAQRYTTEPYTGVTGTVFTGISPFRIRSSISITSHTFFLFELAGEFLFCFVLLHCLIMFFLSNVLLLAFGVDWSSVALPLCFYAFLEYF